MRRALLALAMGGFGIGITEFVIMGILPDVAKALQISISGAGHFISTYALGVVAGAPVLTLLSRKFPQNRALIFLMICFTLFNTLTAFAWDYGSMLVLRFLSGLPHGAFFGIGAVAATRLSKEGKSGQAVAAMFAGLTVANIIGVPLGTWLNQMFSWRATFAMVGLIGLGTIAALIKWMPALKPAKQDQSIFKELGILKQREPLLTLLVTMVGTAGFFSWYSYITPMLTEVSGFEPGSISMILIIAGVGMTVGNVLGGKLSDLFSPVKITILSLLTMSFALVFLSFIAGAKIPVLIMTFVLGVIAFTCGTAVQMLVMDAFKGSEELGSSVNQAAFNIANAIGAFLAGLPISLGYGYNSPQWVGALMAFSGALIAIYITFRRYRLQTKWAWKNSTLSKRLTESRGAARVALED